MCTVVLVRHSEARVRHTEPIDSWSLTPQGSRAAQSLSGADLFDGVSVGFSSPQLKACETLRCIAGDRGWEQRTHSGLDELVTFRTRFLPPKDYDLEIRRLLNSSPGDGIIDELFLGELQRFERTLVEIAAGDLCACIVSHGAILSLFTASVLKVPTRMVFDSIGIPDIAVFDTASWAFAAPWGETLSTEANVPA